jgi:protein involved in sex pheromone biosynthesis
MKKLAIAITAVSFLIAGCQSDILQMEEIQRNKPLRAI